MRELYQRFKKLTGKRGADVADTNNVTRQYVSLLVNNPSQPNNRRLALMMQAEMIKVISEKEKEMADIMGLYAEIVDELNKKERESA